MPELPEVETVKNELAATITGAVIREVLLRRSGLRAPFPEDFAQKLAGQTIEKITRRAKYLLFHLSGGEVMIAHLGMTGRFSVLSGLPNEFATHDHVVFMLKDGRCMVYNDARRFGVMDLCESGGVAKHKLLAHLAPEPLDADFSAEYLNEVFRRRAAPIKPIIMDQKIVVGVGNIYASEALFLAGISPLAPANSPDVAGKIPRLVQSIREVLKEAIAAGGSTINNFAHVSGDAGYFQNKLHVYGRTGQPCTACGAPIISIKQAGRATFFCPKCQK